MRRADRLFQIVQLIRGRRLTTARWLAQRLEVSERTVYRDVADLQYQGVPIEGEAGVGLEGLGGGIVVLEEVDWSCCSDRHSYGIGSCFGD